MKLIIEINKDYYELLRYNVEHGEKYKPFEIIANGKPYEERPQGEWVEKVETKQLGHGWLTTHEIVCSVCGGSGENDENIPQCWKFCPNCGAKMKGGAEE